MADHDMTPQDDNYTAGLEDRTRLEMKKGSRKKKEREQDGTSDTPDHSGNSFKRYFTFKK